MREVVIYFIWLALGMVASILILFPAAFLIFHSDRVTPDAAALGFWPAMILVTYLRLRKYGKDFSDIGLTFKAKRFLAHIAGFFIGAFFMITAFVVLGVAGAIVFIPRAAFYSLIASLIIGFTATLIQTGAEEIVFRGYLLKVLSSNSRATGILISAALFSILHFFQGVNMIGWLNIFLFGVFAAQLFYLTENLWLPMGFHFGWNFFQARIFAFPVYGHENSGIFRSAPENQGIISGGSYGPEGSIVISIALTIAIYSIWRAAKIRSKTPEPSIKLPDVDMARK